MVGLCVWKANLYKNGTFVQKISIVVPYNRPIAGYQEYDVQGADGQILKAFTEFYGSNATLIYMNSYPSVEYATIAPIDIQYPAPVVRPFCLDTAVVGDIFQFRFTDKVILEMEITRKDSTNTRFTWRFIHNGTTLYTLANKSVDSYFTVQWSMYLGRSLGAFGFPLPIGSLDYIWTPNLDCSTKYWLEDVAITHTENYRIVVQDQYTAVDPSIMTAWIEGYEPLVIDDDNPYWNGGISEPGGGDGNFSEDSDDVSEDELPSIDAVGTGMATIFAPTKGQLKSLSEVFWGSQWWTALQNTIEGIDKMFVSLGIVPFSVSKGSTVEVTWLGLSITEVTLTLASRQLYEFDMGTIDLSDDSRIFTSGSALDYSPFSRLGIYLPFIGFQDLDIDECRGTTINLKYRIDILSGTCVALIKIAGKTIYQFTGNCITQIPITSQNFENMFTNAVNVGIALGTARNAAAIASAGEAVSSEMIQQGKMSATAAALDATQRSARVSGANASLGNATANAMMGMKPDFNKTGSVSASASLLTVKQPFLYLKTPRQCLPDHYQRYCGFPSNMTGKLGSFSGYTVVEDIRLNGLVATNGEVEEIYDLLKSGVIV